jgi:alkylhydroperoxidase family enzyme
MLAYASKLTATPWKMTRGDVRKLQRVGFGDAEIHDIAAVTGHFAFVNRLADGLGVELEPYWGRKREERRARSASASASPKGRRR